MRNLPDMKDDIIMKKRIAMGKDKDKGRRFDRSKVQVELICDGYNDQRCVYSNKMVGAKGGPKNMMWRRFSNGRKEGTRVVPRYQATNFMFRGNCFVETILNNNITITWVGRKQRMAEKTEDS